MKFEELGLVDEVMEGVHAMNFKECTPIQAETIPHIIEGRDILASAQTGTGKTAAYLLPLLNNLALKEHNEDKVNAVIMAPTRELAVQIDRLMEGFAYFMSVSSIPVYGGNDGSAFSQQKKGLELGGDVVIATPGRLLSHLRMDYVDFSGVKYFILDEADRMLDMGFFDDIMEVISYLPKERQTILFSATFPEKIQKLAQKILNDPLEVKLSISKPASGINQKAYVCHEHQKLPLVEELIRKHDSSDKCIIFASSKDKVKELYKTLTRKKVPCEQMHSDLEQAEREQIMSNFKNGKIQVLVATDILSRGIDIDDITLIVNYDVPNQEEDYVHRVGRTARAGATGEAVTFISERDQGRFGRIEQFIEKEIDKVPLPEELGEGPQYDPRARRNDISRGNDRSRRNNVSSTKRNNNRTTQSTNGRSNKNYSEKNSKQQKTNQNNGN